MNRSRLEELQRTARRVVRDAAVPGGMLDQGGFTLAVARRNIAKAMGLNETAFDGDDWRRLVRKEVQLALDNIPRASSPTDAAASRREIDDAQESDMSSPIDEPPHKKQKTTARVAKRDAAGHASDAQQDDGAESDMSSVYDVPSKRKSSKKAPSARGETRKKKTKKDPDEGLPPDEAKVVKLKRIVVACGVRKQWSKELADCSTSKDQARHLQALLNELGMQGAPTLAKAKSIKEARELAQELDDVKEFEATRGLADSGRPRRRSGARQTTLESDSNDEIPDKRESALGAVLDFLGNVDSD